MGHEKELEENQSPVEEAFVQEQPGADSAVERTVQQSLTDQQVEILSFEKKFFKYAGVKERAITTELGMTPIQYYQQVFALLDHPAAAAAEPALMSRLNNMRAGRQRRRVL